MPNQLYAGFTKRFFAFIIDALVGTAISTIVIKLIAWLMSEMLSVRVSGAISTAILLLYFTLMTYFNDGQTLGKMIMGLKVVPIKHDKLTWLTVLIRECAGRYIHMFSFFSVFYLLTAVTPRKQNMSDFFADTLVVDISKLACYEAGQIDGAKSCAVEAHPSIEIPVVEDPSPVTTI